MVHVDEIDERFIEEVESECTLGRGAWDMVDPREIIAAAINVAAVKGMCVESAEHNRLTELIDCPHNDDWFEGVRIEAAHQQERWGTAHDAGKEPQDWFWLLGYPSGKCLRACIDGDNEKAKHHTISSAAALLNWYRRIAGQEQAMRPGIEEPTGAH